MLDLSIDENATCPPKPHAEAEAFLAEVVEGRADMDERCLVYDEEESPRICDIPLDNSKQPFRIVRISIAQYDCGTFHCQSGRTFAILLMLRKRCAAERRK